MKDTSGKREFRNLHTKLRSDAYKRFHYIKIDNNISSVADTIVFLLEKYDKYIELVKSAELK